MLEAKSKFYPDGHPDNNLIVADIYFPTDGSKLGQDDTAVLQEVAHHFRDPLRENSITFGFIGHTDARGDDKYNRRLGKRRAESVQQKMDDYIKSDHYQSFATVSRGEKDAIQKGATDEQMAKERRVSVVSSWSKRKLYLPPIEIDGNIPKIKRITHRSWTSLPQASNLFGFKPNRETDKEIIAGCFDIVSGLISNKAKFRNTFRRESKSCRKSKMVPASHAINAITVRTTSLSFTQGFAAVAYSSCDMEYNWGRPSACVKLTKQFVAKQEGRVIVNREASKNICRSKMQKYWFYNVPKP